MTHTPIDRDAVPLRQDALVIALVGLAHATSHFGHLLLPPLFAVFAQEFGLSYAQLGSLMSVFFVVSGLGQASSGFVVDRIGARPMLFGALALFALAAAMASQASGYTSLLGVAALAGLANATFHPVDFTILNQRVSAPRLGHAFSVHGLTGNLGWALAPVFLGGLTALTSWRVAYAGAAALFLAVLAVLVWQRALLQTRSVHHSTPNADDHSLAFMRLPVVWWCFLFFLLSTMTLAVVQGFAVPILQARHAVSFQTATLTLTAYMLCGALGMAVGGFVAARSRHSERVVALAMGSGAALLAVCALDWLPTGLTLVVLAATGFAVGIGGPSRDLMIKRATPPGATGRVYGLVYSGLDVGFALSPLLFGQLMDRGWYGATLLGAALVLLLSVGAALAVGRRSPAALAARAV
ncbi:MAG: MFS transporter [Rhodoferax sp.]